ncbi:hypothetical protein ACQP00_49675 [Dactylosporangium sp. CS-047395]|uniref:hypothetical protein n=1 Tax=Dactylosporangium sp. CS-047395 TaxID=3239936 RepID=UPI003D9309ED
MITDQEVVETPGGEPPACTVRFDRVSGCGVNIEVHQRGETPLIALRFVTFLHIRKSHELTLDQVEQLRAALDVVSRNVRGPYAFSSIPETREDTDEPDESEEDE